MAALDRRVHLGQPLLDSMRAHGAAGVLIEPERSLVASSDSRPRAGSRRHTALYRAHLPEAAFETIAKSLAEGVGIAATARIQNVDKKTVLLVLAKAAAHIATLHRTILMNLVVSECQLDEMWSFVGKKEKNLQSVEKLQGELGDAWIWVAFDAVNKIVVAWVVGKRTLPHAVALLHEVKRVTAHMPTLFSSDQLDQYQNALLQVYGELVLPPRKPGPGRPPKPRLVPPKDLLYVQVVKQYKKYRVVKVTRMVVFGDPDTIKGVLRNSKTSRTINTAFIERNNGTIRHLDARCTRKTLRFSKCLQNHERELALALAYYHLCLPHGTLTKRYGRPTTPFMAAGLTDHVWTMGELLGARAEDHCR
jgi:IS1 family transposase